MSRFALALLPAALLRPCAGTGALSYSDYSFEAFLAEHGKAYEPAELPSRSALFQESLRTVQEHNRRYAAGNRSWFMAMTKFADWSNEEFEAILTAKQPLPAARFAVPKVQENPKEVDWRSKGAVSDVKDQGHCGSCWAFSAVEVLESHYAIASGKMLTLSPQSFVDCVANPEECGGTGGCSGATYELAFNHSVYYGVALEEDVKYEGKDRECKPYKAAVKASDYVKLPENDADAVETALATKGPVGVSVAAGTFKLYGGGVFSGCSEDGGEKGTTLNHAVVAVGYTEEAWIVRNSWGPKWGEQGYIRISRKNDKKTFVDKEPASGAACKPYPESQVIAGECGVLFDTSYPTGVQAADRLLVV